jgi:surface antigen
VRRHGGWYHGYGHHHNDSNAFKWLAFTAITLKLLDNLNEAQQRKHEAAQIEATTAPVGQSVTWQEGSSSGSVTTIKEGQDSSGAYCREFQQEIIVGGEVEQAYGTACLQPDGAWKIVSD